MNSSKVGIVIGNFQVSAVQTYGALEQKEYCGGGSGKIVREAMSIT
jgi:hypothetical protein